MRLTGGFREVLGRRTARTRARLAYRMLTALVEPRRPFSVARVKRF